MPEDKVEQLKADFESRKVNAKESAAKRLSDAKEAFMSEKRITWNALKRLVSTRSIPLTV